MQSPHRFAPAAPEETHLFGACSPGWHSVADHATALDDWIASMQARGVGGVCCLVPGEKGGNLGRYRRAFGEANVRHVPVPDYRLADAETLREHALPFVSDARGRDRPVVVHCLDGLGRTGQVLAAWLVRDRGYGVCEALETVGEMGRDPAAAVRRDNATRRDLHDSLAALA